MLQKFKIKETKMGLRWFFRRKTTTCRLEVPWQHTASYSFSLEQWAHRYTYLIPWCRLKDISDFPTHDLNLVRKNLWNIGIITLCSNGWYFNLGMLLLGFDSPTLNHILLGAVSISKDPIFGKCYLAEKWATVLSSQFDASSVSLCKICSNIFMGY